MEETFYDILPSGVQIVHRTSSSEVAYVGIMVGAGTRNEDAALNGMAHYIEHCVFKGCRMHQPDGKEGRTITSKAIIDHIEGLGGEVNAYTTKEETTFYAAVPFTHFKQTLRLLASMVLHPTFPKKETDKETEVILDEIESYEDSPSELIYDDFEALLFQGHPLALPILGTRKTLKRISKSAEEPLKWMQREYRPERMVVFSNGPMSWTSVQKEVRRLFNSSDSAPLSSGNDDISVAGIQQGKTVSPALGLSADCRSTLDSIPYSPQQATFNKHTHQTHVMLGGRAYRLGHEKQLGLYLLNNILGGGSMSSRLNMSLREKQGLVYTIESQYTPLSDTGYWGIYFASDEGDRDRCIELIRKELIRLREEKLSATQWHNALIQLRGQMAISAEQKENNVLAMAKMMLYYHHAPMWQDTFRKIEKFTPSELQDIAAEVLNEDKISLLIYG